MKSKTTLDCFKYYNALKFNSDNAGFKGSGEYEEVFKDSDFGTFIGYLNSNYIKFPWNLERFVSAFNIFFHSDIKSENIEKLMVLK